MSIRTPKTEQAATLLLQRFAQLLASIDLHENARNDAIAAANAEADTSLAPLIKECDEIRSKLEPWWKQAAAALTGGKRKSVQLGGCMIGTRTGRASLAIDGDEEAIVAKLEKRTWAAGLLRITTKLDKTAILKAVPGEHGKKLKALGLTKSDGAETFYVERAEQDGTVAAVG